SVSATHAESVPSGDTIGISVNSGAATCTVTLPASTCTIANTAIGAGGPYSVVATYNGDANLTTSTKTATAGLTVSKGNQTITFTSTNPSPVDAGGPTYTPTATATSGDAVTITLDGSSSGCTLSSGVVTFTAAGTCLVDANSVATTNWNAAPQVQQSITVSTAVTLASVGSATGSGSSITSSTFPSVQGTTYLVALTTNDGSTLTPTLTTPSNAAATLIGSTSQSGGFGGNCQDSSHCQLWTWWFNAKSNASGVSVSVSFNHSADFASIDVLKVSGNDTTTPVITASTSTAAGCSSFFCGNDTSTATANLAHSPQSGDMAVEIIGSDEDMNTTGLSWTPATTNVFQQANNANGGLGVYDTFNPAQQNESTSVSGFSNSSDWMTIALEINGAG
ncbi:MAG TPA: hypothetical protein VMF35_10990, partial [Acidimicrobiales bacterium]|nr:hypothetical protein [Acidimicrobiales bacterium]